MESQAVSQPPCRETVRAETIRPLAAPCPPQMRTMPATTRASRPARRLAESGQRAPLLVSYAVS